MSVSPSAVPGDQYLGGLFMFVYRVMREHLFLTVLLPLAAMAIAYIAARQLPPVYTAQGNIRIGKVDGVDTMSLMGVVSRINSPSFKQHVIETMKVPAVGGNRPAQLIFESLAARQETTDTVAVSVRATGAQQARDAVAAAVGLLNEEQRKIREPLEADIKEQLATNEATIAGLLEARNSLSALAKEGPKEGSIDPASLALRRVWLSDLISRNEQRLTAARAERHALSAKLGVWKTYPTTLLDEAFVLPGFSFARPVAIAIFSGAVVFLIFFLGVVLHRPKVVHPN